ncbi:MAG: hypothetical protein B7X90_01715 [Novosphingobium sp. 17-62-19]|uniref:tyrosine-type recombinase/integrase n=1 Tax=Novosphingobium sp. 17-62-19 TaxID=1970406 RepID=UPI000BCB0E4B|nr:integrase arm-type DNA-binding domain-containing protein [Novosphingobium sp. 17-62-19]OYX95024.1 MAG: hypothetical protein B7Y74_05450 [Novosphingobium sp. 35-62-5]OZA21445.1 MAG: hypothetical protein B7X90_01715 [Novosphingobium sp. 17-62-19]HQS95102.1 integrase arm-type DNA-binding domain-containing protein [Novosphingobium sp.]
MLSDADLRRARLRARPYKLWDGQGLHLLIVPNGRRTWLLRSRAGGRERLVTIGTYPDVGIEEARRRADLARVGLPFSDALTSKTFEQCARDWHALHAPHWSTVHAADVLASLERDVFPAIGGEPVAEIGAPDVLSAIRAVEARGNGQTARRLRQRCAAVFGYAIAEGLRKDDNPARDIGQALLPPRLSRPHPALTSIEDCRALLMACDLFAGASEMVRLASRFLALTAVRLDAVRGMVWDEIEQHAGVTVWRVPPARMKLAKAKKEEARFAHLVPLSQAAVAVLGRAAELSGSRNGLVFRGRAQNSPIGERAILDLYAEAGFRGRHVPHGWRASFSTIMNERRPGDRSAIDLALAHTPKDKVEAAYNRAEMLDQRHALLEEWGALLCG